ncbi:sensor histidine kinase TmoS [Kordia sp. SMS9]|uniref:response regulator n=1 Tax=Kordia sp. SMS9 TaxID=2282170 RepID=UPI000E0CE414|nr:response regulator [Kordia sp. SMS9]AXG69229.1 sensor histidine kinase TmoS [Kordia sp. SMS9]
MNCPKNLHRKILFGCALLIGFFSYSNNKDTNTSESKDLRTTLLATHQKKLREKLDLLKVAVNTIDSAKAYTDICKIYYKSTYYLKEPRYDSILYYSDKVVQLTKNKLSPESKKQFLVGVGFKGTVYLSLGDLVKALNYFNIIIAETEDIFDHSFFDRRQSATTNISEIYAIQKNYQLALDQFDALFTYINKKNITTTKISSIVYLRYARYSRELGNMDIALDFINKALTTATRNKYVFRTAMAYLELAHLYVDTNDIIQADLFLEKAHDILINEKNYLSLLSKYYYLKALMSAKKNDLSMKLYNAEKAFGLIMNQNVSERHIAFANLLYNVYKEKGLFEKANTVLEKIATIKNKISNNKQLKKSLLLEIQRRDESIALVEAESETLNQVILFIVLLFIIALIAAIYIYKDRRKKMELVREIVKKNKELKQLDDAKSLFFSNITHELQTPLTLITGPLEQALNSNNEQLDVVTKSKLKMAMKNTASLKTLINDILDLSKLKVKKMALHTRRTALDTFLNTIMQKFVPLMKQKQLTFDFCFKNLEHLHTIIDTKKLEKVLSNLLSNAIKYTPAKGTISVYGKLDTKDILVISVKDTGVGISIDDIPLVFDRYFQSKDTSKPLEGGYGIGLSLVKELVELMNGTIYLQSEIDKGSEFIVTLPLKNVTKKTKMTFTNVQVPTIEAISDHFTLNTEVSDKTILIVEDHPEMQQFIASILQENYQLVIVNNGKEALDKLQSTAVDLIVSDVMMPAMDGFTLLETLKESDAYREIPIIMLTALSDIKYKLNALTIGVDDYLTKPFIASELLARIQNLLQRYQSRKEFKEEIEATVHMDDELLEMTPKNNSIYMGLSVKTSKSDTELIEKVAEIIEENMDNSDFKLNDLSEKTYLSERQLRRKIKLITGLSPKKFQREIQLLKARTLFEDGTYNNVKAVAMSVGMHNTTRFSKLYMERFGKHPSNYFQI